MIYWFTGASTQAVTTGAYRAVEFIKANIQARGVEKASVEDSKKVVEICTKYAQKGMLNIFIAVFFATLAFSFLEPFFFIGYLISIAIFGLYQADLHGQCRRRVGQRQENRGSGNEAKRKRPSMTRPSSATRWAIRLRTRPLLQLNPVIKFTTLFGRLAVELAVRLTAQTGGTLTHVLSAAFFVVSFVFVYRSFYACAFVRHNARGRLRMSGERGIPNLSDAPFCF